MATARKGSCLRYPKTAMTTNHSTTTKTWSPVRRGRLPLTKTKIKKTQTCLSWKSKRSKHSTCPHCCKPITNQHQSNCNDLSIYLLEQLTLPTSFNKVQSRSNPKKKMISWRWGLAIPVTRCRNARLLLKASTQCSRKVFRKCTTTSQSQPMNPKYRRIPRYYLQACKSRSTSLRPLLILKMPINYWTVKARVKTNYAKLKRSLIETFRDRELRICTTKWSTFPRRYLSLSRSSNTLVATTQTRSRRRKKGSTRSSLTTRQR